MWKWPPLWWIEGRRQSKRGMKWILFIKWSWPRDRRISWSNYLGGRVFLRHQWLGKKPARNTINSRPTPRSKWLLTSSNSIHPSYRLAFQNVFGKQPSECAHANVEIHGFKLSKDNSNVDRTWLDLMLIFQSSSAPLENEDSLHYSWTNKRGRDGPLGV